MGCGIDVIVFLENPNLILHSPEITDAEVSTQYFAFKTRDRDNTYNEDNYSGTAVYYRIYNSSSILNNETSALITLSQDEEKKYNAATKLIESYNYKPLNLDNKGTIIKKSDTDQKVYIRLSDYKGIPDYSARIEINDKILYKPMRDFSSEATFNFTGSSEIDKIPSSDDSDVKYTAGSGEDGIWYVAMFALSVGKDENFVPIYSNIQYLGAVKIDKNEILE